MTNLLTFADIEQAAKRLAGVAVRTPVLTNETLNTLAGAEVFLKVESLQRSGSFKFRGAYNTIAQLPAETRAVVACSSGNHAQGVALAARLNNLPATIVMPGDAPATKVARTQADGAQIIFYDRQHEDRQAIASAEAQRLGAELVLPYDDYRVMAGQGTCGLELAEQAPALDAVMVCCGGGGLTAGIATAMAALEPQLEVITVEPAGFDDHARSFLSARRERNPQLAGSICDALLAEMPGELTFKVNQPLVRRGVAVTDEQVKTAMAVAFGELKLVLEPGGAAALAGALNHSRALGLRGARVGVILSGGNVDPDLFSTCVTTALPAAPQPAS